MVEADGLTKSYRKGAMVTEVLKGVSLRLRAGEFVAIMGSSGSGKSTLLNLLGFLDRPDGGSYRLDGADLSQADDDALSAVRNQKIGFVFQQFHLLERASATRNVTLPLLYSDDDGIDGSERAEHALAAVGLAHRGHHMPGELSGGEQQRVAIARALINNPALILADEPTGNLDVQSGSEVLDIFRRLAGEGRAIVLDTHDRVVAERADRNVVLQAGRIVPSASSGEGVVSGGDASGPGTA
ncbi:MAG: ABC transporter ATP-binding protein [Gemmatimonadota bacterium]|nr:ABC transporter ATP-binding protein [Gemmatimonadota bacterium]